MGDRESRLMSSTAVQSRGMPTQPAYPAVLARLESTARTMCRQYASTHWALLSKIISHKDALHLRPYMEDLAA